MYNKYLSQEDLNVKVGDKVKVTSCHEGIVTEVFKGIEKEWDGSRYIDKPGTEWTQVRVHFNDELSKFGQYQDAVYGGFNVIKED